MLEDVSIEVHSLTVSYEKRPVLWDIDFTLPVGEIIGIIGPNGSGKTTLLKAIMGLVPISSGYVKLFDKPFDKVRSRISYVPQRESVDWDFPASVMDVVLMGRYTKKNLLTPLKERDYSIAKEVLEQVDMLPFADRQISKLSGGQQQRVFIARSLAQQADIYIMDEPFVGIDAATEEAILNLLTDLKNKGKTVIIVHHDLQTSYQYFNWLVMLNTRLVVCGKKEDVFTSKFLQEAYGGKLNVLSKVGDLIKDGEFSVREKDVL
ncbi:metal ABC transporter ATP-binding protein [Ichthyobacterium seriolicida]|uniref:Manganese ABC transporter, ATP-binding protein SitB n=1 Tax=Ichthyobacterium seriolicida TaxID=242600 RepID=A0A1J1E8I2_9FLAO|nr:metal ABC transporter ATP-binding protein [Ichthyobacterium seriolicida]BAV94243.1 manganese ABC transporter, ATP-binding protein SitB [Ichthyobacterium seriolicida]